MAFPILAAMAGLQGVLGGAQFIKGLVDSAGNIRPKREQPSLDPLKQSVSDSTAQRARATGAYNRAAQRARYGMSAAEQGLALSNINNASAVERGNIANSGLSQYGQAAALANQALQRQSSLAALSAQNAQMRDQNMGMAQNALGMVGQAGESVYNQRGQLFNADTQQKDKTFGDAMDQYQQQAQAASGQIGAGLQNMFGGMSSIGKMQQMGQLDGIFGGGQQAAGAAPNANLNLFNSLLGADFQKDSMLNELMTQDPVNNPQAMAQFMAYLKANYPDKYYQLSTGMISGYSAPQQQAVYTGMPGWSVMPNSPEPVSNRQTVPLSGNQSFYAPGRIFNW